jgi:hypothetical protein
VKVADYIEVKQKLTLGSASWVVSVPQFICHGLDRTFEDKAGAERYQRGLKWLVKLAEDEALSDVRKALGITR